MNFELIIALMFAIEISTLCAICFFMYFTNKLTQETLFLIIKWIEELHKIFPEDCNKKNEN